MLVPSEQFHKKIGKLRHCDEVTDLVGTAPDRRPYVRSRMRAALPRRSRR